MRVFVSYKRNDLDDTAAVLHESFNDWYVDPGDEFFVDVDSIEGGTTWSEALDESLGKADVLVALIGPKWEPSPHIKREVRTAFAREIPVVPVLAPRANLPAESELPPALRPLLARQAVRLSGRRPTATSLLSLWAQLEVAAFGLSGRDAVWLRWLLSESEPNGYNVARVRALCARRRRYHRLSKLSLQRLEELLEELCEAGCLVYTEDENYYYYWYKPTEEIDAEL